MNQATILIEEVLEEIGAFLVLYGFIFSISGLLGLVLFVLKGFGLYEMSKTLELKNPWISFVPVVSVFSLGRVGQNYVKQDGTRSAKFSIALIVLYILQFVFAIGFLIALIFAVVEIVSNAQNVLDTNSAMTLQMFYSLIPAIILYFVTLAFAIAYSIVYYIALWRVFAIFEHENATMFTVLSIFFKFLPPIFLFLIRKKRAKLTYNERMGIDEIQMFTPIE